jgi:hypothetical protein
MLPITADDSSSSVLAYLIFIPIVILFAAIGVAVTCSEKWNKSDHRLKRFCGRLKHKNSGKVKASRSPGPTEESDKSEASCIETDTCRDSENTITVPLPAKRVWE